MSNLKVELKDVKKATRGYDLVECLNFLKSQSLILDFKIVDSRVVITPNPDFRYDINLSFESLTQFPDGHFLGEAKKK